MYTLSHHLRRAATLLPAAALLLCTMPPALALDIVWTNSAGGNFQEAANWHPNIVPDVDDTAIFDLGPGTNYTVTWVANVTNHTHLVWSGDVTFNLQGHTYSLSRESSNKVGRASTPVTLICTNGTIRRLNADWLKNISPYNLVLQKDSKLHILDAVHDKIAYYSTYHDGTEILVSGSGAKFEAIGYFSSFYGTVVITNGAKFNQTAGTGLRSGGSVIAYGPGNIGTFCPGSGGIPAESRFALLNGAAANHGYGKVISLSGILELRGGAHYYENYTYNGVNKYGWITMSHADAEILGDGHLQMSMIELNQGTICPGGIDEIGTLTLSGVVTNASPGDGFLEFDLASADDYDQLKFKYVSNRGPDHLYADGIVLRIKAFPEFAPVRRTDFNLINDVAITGVFHDIELPDIRGAWETSLLYSEGILTYIPPPAETLIMIR